MKQTTAQTISEHSRDLLLTHNGLIFGQCLTAVGWVGGTVPELTEDQGLIELSMADVAGGSIAVGAALSGRRVIYVVRYQGFMWYNAASIVNYAAKSKDMWGIPCPIMVRGIGMDGSIGPVASGAHHSLVARMPGIAVAAPMSGQEWSSVFNWWMANDDPIYVSESRRSFDLVGEMSDLVINDAEVVVVGIGPARISVTEAVKQLNSLGIRTAGFGLVWLRPLQLSKTLLDSVRNARLTLIVESDYESCSVASTVANRLWEIADGHVSVSGLDDRTAGFSRESDNTTPTHESIIKSILHFLNGSIATRQ